MIEDYLAQGINYEEDYPSVNLFPAANRTLRQKEKHKKEQKKRNRKSASNSILQSKNYNKDLQSRFKSLGSRGSKISKNVSSVLDTVKLILGIALVVGAALFSITKYIDAKDSVYNPEYAPDGGEHGAYGGRYKETSDTAKIKNKIIDEAQKQGIDPALALALAERESGFNPKAKSPTGAMGIYQMTSDACKQVGIPKSEKLYDPDYNIHYGLKYLKWCLDHTKSVEEALFAWNNGIGNLRKAKKAGDRLDSWENAKKVGDGRGFTQKVMPNISKYQQQLENMDAQVQKELGSSGAGNFRKYSNGYTIGGYKMSNTVAHGGKYYIELSDRAESYLRDVGGSGRVTSGAEGNTHARGSGMTHMAGNKIDVTAFNKNDDNEWADVAIPFLKNKNTAFVVFEGFTRTAFIKIRNIIYSKLDANTKNMCEKKARQAGWGKLGGKYLDYDDSPKSMKNGRHLDIGILTTAYSKKQAKQEEKSIVKETPPPNTTKVKDNNKQLKNKKEIKTSVNAKIPSAENTVIVQPNNTKPNPAIKDLSKRDVVNDLISQSETRSKITK